MGSDLLSSADAPTQEHIGNPVGFLVKDGPSDLPAVGDGGGGLDQLVLLPGDPLFLLDLGVDLYQGDFLTV